MKVRSGTTLWSGIDPHPLKLLPLTANAHCQIVVLGGGITGALAGYYLAKAGAKVILLDRGEIGRASTAASTGLLQYEVDTPLAELIKKVGQQHAVHAYRRGLTAIDEIEQLVAEIGDHCGFARCDTLYFASTCWHQRRLQREYECRRKFGFDVELLTRRQLAEISTIDAAVAMRSRGDAQIDPYRFTQRLVQSAMGHGLIAHSNTKVKNIDEGPDAVMVHTDGGTVRADIIVYATGYESEQHLSEPKANLNSTYAVASQANFDVPGWPDDWLIWETARPYFYGRRTPDGRVIIGGGDTEFSDDHTRDGLVERKVDKLLARFQTLFANAEFTPEYAWAGTFAETKDGLAYIGRPIDRPRAYFALGYGGNGITFSVIAAKLIADLFAGRANFDAEVFRFGR